MTAPPRRIRADVLVVERGLAESRTRAQALILAGSVVADGGGSGERRVDKAGDLLRSDCTLRLKGEPLRYVSRGGLKLEHALQTFPVPVSGARCLDLGASTGGFTDCLLQHGAAHVVAVDVGQAQLHSRLRQDPRVESHEGMHAKDLPPAWEPFDLLVADVSFISLRRVLPLVIDRVRPGGWLVVLVKPQFECGRDWVESGGVVRDPEARARAVAEVSACLVDLGAQVHGHVPSPLLGPAGNVEFLLAAQRG